MTTHGAPSIAVTTDVVLLCMHNTAVHLLLVQRKYPPFAGQWALPGGFVEANESLATAAQRELYEETGVRDVYVEHIGAFGDPGRDPRRQIVSIAFLGLSATCLPITTSDETPQVAWWPLAHRPTPLAFDHDQIVAQARTHLMRALMYSPVALRLLPRTFQISDVRHVYEQVCGHHLDASQFATRWLASGAIVASSTPGYYQACPTADAHPFCMPWPDFRH